MSEGFGRLDDAAWVRRQTIALRAVAGLGTAESRAEVLFAICHAGKELLLCGSGLLVEDGKVVQAQPEGLVGLEVGGLSPEEVGAIESLELGGKPVGAACTSAWAALVTVPTRPMRQTRNAAVVPMQSCQLNAIVFKTTGRFNKSTM